MLGNTAVWFPEFSGDGGVQAGLIGSGGGAGGGGGAELGAGAGEISIWGTAHPVPSISAKTRIMEITRYFTFIPFIANIIVAKSGI